MQARTEDWFERCLDNYPNLPSVVLIRSMELKFFPRGYLQPPVLDLCCGDGFFARSLGVSGMFGCDIDRNALMAAAAFRNTYRQVIHADARSLSAFSDSSFNSVFSNCALEHVDGVDRALASIGRVLKPGGRLIMSVPDARLNAWFFPARLLRGAGFGRQAEKICREYNQKQQHMNILSRSAWTDKLEQNGLSVEKSFYLFNEREYGLITFFESFVLDAFPGPMLGMLDSVFRKSVPLEWRKSLWRRLLKPIYEASQELAEGGELFIVARKRA